MQASNRANVLVVSDLHHGSIYGMMPPDFQSSDERVIPQNPGQKYLWECWEHLCERLKGTKIDAIVVNGDPLDGRQEAQRGSELGISLQFDHKDATYQTLNYLLTKLKNPPIYFVQGTEYHDGKGGELVEHIAQMIGAQKYKGLGTGKWSHEVLDLEIDGVVINFSHGISVAGGLYRATSPDREAVWSALAGKDGKTPKADCIVRSHAHYFVHLEHYSKHAVITPCWQLQTRYMRKNSVYRMLPDIGAVLITVDPDAKRSGRDPIHIEKFLYPLPEIRTTKLVRP